MTVPNITLEQIIATYPTETVETCREVLSRCNKAIDAYNESSTYQPLISVDEARKLGAGKAEYSSEYSCDPCAWHICWQGCEYQDEFRGRKFKYRAIKQPEPVEQRQENDNSRGFDKLAEKQHPELLIPTCQVKNLDTGELKTMTREKAKLLQAETKGVCDWFDPNGTNSTFGLPPNKFEFDAGDVYTYKLKADQVKLNGKFMTREAAIALWESKKDTCDVWFIATNGEWAGLGESDFPANHTRGEYELRERPLKQIEWKDVPVGVMTNKGELRKVIYTRHAEGARMQVETNQNSSTANGCEFYSAKDLELAPVDQQDWIAVQDLDSFKRGTLEQLGFIVEYKKDEYGYLVVFRITGIAKGWELK